MRKGFSLLLTLIGIMVGLTGCSSDSALTETTIEIQKKGKVIQTIVEDFAESYYDLEELETQTLEACETYNARMGADMVQLKSAKVEDGVLTMVMVYQDPASYAGFNQQALYVGTVAEAYQTGYDMDVVLFSAGEEDYAIDKNAILNMGEKHIAIVREAGDVKVWDQVLFYSQDAVPASGENTVTVLDSDALTYIVFE